MKRKLFLLFPFGVCIIFIMASCNKENFITSSDASLFVSSDSIKFDTVFTSIGSITKSFKIINQNNNSEIELLKEYKTALISEVVTGKVDVRNEKLN